MSTYTPDIGQAEEADGWATLSCRLDAGGASAAAIGLVTLANDAVIEPELRRFLPLPGVEVFSSRIAMARDLSPESLGAMEEDLPRAVRLLLPDDHLDAIAFGCTSGSTVIGSDRIAGIIASVRPGVAVTDPARASLAAFAALGVGRPALVTPYPANVNRIVEGHLARHGLDVRARASFRQESDVTIGRIDPEDIFEAGVALGRLDVDSVFLSCTALRCSSVIERIEHAIDKPVVSSNQALAWHALRSAGNRSRVEGFGRLFRLQARGETRS